MKLLLDMNLSPKIAGFYATAAPSLSWVLLNSLLGAAQLYLFVY